MTLAPVDLAGYGATAQTVLASAFAPLCAVGHGTTLVGSTGGSNAWHAGWAPVQHLARHRSRRGQHDRGAGRLPGGDRPREVSRERSGKVAAVSRSSALAAAARCWSATRAVCDVPIGRGAGDTLVGGGGSDTLAFGATERCCSSMAPAAASPAAAFMPAAPAATTSSWRVRVGPRCSTLGQERRAFLLSSAGFQPS